MDLLLSPPMSSTEWARAIRVRARSTVPAHPTGQRGRPIGGRSATQAVRRRLHCMPGHQVLPYANELSVKRAARSRHVCLLLGAGTACACGLPDMAALQTQVLAGLGGEQATAFEQQSEHRNIEQVLSRVRRIAALLDGGTDEVDDLTADNARALDREMCRLIVEAVGLTNADLAPAFRLAARAARADYHLPVEMFTVNYDLLLETALESLGVPYFDGFVGALRARFRTELVEAGPGFSCSGMCSGTRSVDGASASDWSGL